MSLIKPYKGLHGGWSFEVNSIKIGENTPVFFFNGEAQPLKVILVNERDVGFNYITNK
jgi:hypothetical protein